MARSWMMARLIGGPANGRFVRIFIDNPESEIYRVLLRVESRPGPVTGQKLELGHLVAKYRYSRLSETEFDGSIPIMLYGFVKLEK